MTATKSRSRARPKPGIAAPPDVLEQIKRVVSGARRKATKLTSEQKPNRSTATRHALRLKADALDEVAGLLRK